MSISTKEPGQKSTCDVLEIDGSTVFWKRNDITFRRFSFDPDSTIRACALTTFIESKNQSCAAVIFADDTAYVYHANGASYVFNIPFVVKAVFSCSRGLIIERNTNSLEMQYGDSRLSRQLHTSQFTSGDGLRLFCMSDPMAQLGQVVSSSTTSMEPDEELFWFPSTGTICVTLNRGKQQFLLYYVRYLSKNYSKITRSKRRSSLRRASRKVADESGAINSSAVLSRSLSQQGELVLDQRLSARGVTVHRRISMLNAEDRRTSFELGRAEANSAHAHDRPVQSLGQQSWRKEALMTQICSLDADWDPALVKIESLAYEDVECLCILDQCKGALHIYTFSHSEGRPKLESHRILEAIDMLIMNGIYGLQMRDSLKQHHILLTQTRDNRVSIVDPVLQVSCELEVSGRTKEIHSSRIAISGDGARMYFADFLEKDFKHVLALSTGRPHELVEKCLRTLSLILKPADYCAFNFMFIREISTGKQDQVEALGTVLLSWMLQSGEQVNSEIQWVRAASALKNGNNGGVSGTVCDFGTSKTHIILALHLIHEELTLDISSTNSRYHLEKILSVILGKAGWTWGHPYHSQDHFGEIPTIEAQQVSDTPPNLCAALTASVTTGHAPYLQLGEIVSCDAYTMQNLLPRTSFCLDFFAKLREGPSQHEKLFEFMLERGMSLADVSTFPEGLQVPMWEVISLTRQEFDRFGISSVARLSDTLAQRAFSLLERDDASIMSSPSRREECCGASFWHNDESKNPKAGRDLKLLLAEQDRAMLSDANTINSSWDEQAEADRLLVARQIFSDDRRFYEVSRLLQRTSAQSAILVQDSSEQEWMAKQRLLLQSAVLRVFAVSLGVAAFHFSTKIPLVTEKLPKVMLNFNVVISPSNVTVPMDDTLVQDKLVFWGHFHAGVSTGLTVSRDAKHVSGSWIVFNKPQNSMDAQHAGFLMGLGMNGHLKKLQEWHIYNYLSPKDVPTSVALLIGLSASNLGSMDQKLTRVLSVHVPALMPTGSSDLNVPTLTQMAGIFGIGLLYWNTQQRRMSDILFNEIRTGKGSSRSREARKTMPELELREGYCLAAGFSLGIINLGKGKTMSGLADMDFVTGLLDCALQTNDAEVGLNTAQRVPGALMALILMFMKSGHKPLAHKIAVPANFEALNYIRPDIMFLRTLGKHLIEWDNIGKSIWWIESNIPKSIFYTDWADLNSLILAHDSITFTSDHMYFCYILAAVSLSICFKYVSTADKEAKETVLRICDFFYWQSVKEVKDNKNRADGGVRQCVYNCYSTTIFGLACLCAGTGDLDALRCIRRGAGSLKTSMSYGTHMANQMALGILFLGGGMYALSNGLKGLAGLVISSYVLWPRDIKDNACHLQAARHLWVLATESRCVVVRHARSGALVRLDLQVTKKDGSQGVHIAPCLLPPLDDIKSIETMSTKFARVFIPVEDETHPFSKALRESLVIYVVDACDTVASFNAGNGLIHDNFTSTFSRAVEAIEDSEFDNSIFENMAVDRLDGITPSTEKFDAPTTVESLIKKTNDLGLTLDLKLRDPSSAYDLWDARLLLAFDSSWSDSALNIVSHTQMDTIKTRLWNSLNML